MAKQPLSWHTEQRKVVDLIPYLKNPRTETERGKELMKHSLKKFNFAEIPAINTDNTIIAGHQRIGNMIELERTDEMIDVRVPSRKLSAEEIKEYNILSNRITEINSWDNDKLQENLTREELEFFNFLDVLDMTPPNYEGQDEYHEAGMLTMTITFETLDKKRKFMELIEKYSPVNLATINDKINAFVEKFYVDEKGC